MRRHLREKIILMIDGTAEKRKEKDVYMWVTGLP